ncbi:MAG: diguanylate cyclase [Treponema sp.]|nr:diguanylate cyclase [Candidatus Treponema equi]
MKKRKVLFKSKYASAKLKEESMLALHQSFHKILKLDLKKDIFDEIKVLAEEKHVDKGYCHKFSEWAKNFAMTGNIYKDDVDSYLQFIDLENIKYLFRTEVKKHSIKYRRSISNEIRWVTLDVIPAVDFSEKNQIVYLYVYDIHESLSEELYNSKLMTAIAHAMTRSHLVSLYIDLDRNTTNLIYANEYVQKMIDEIKPQGTHLDDTVKFFTHKSCVERMLEFVNLDTINERLKDKNSITMEYIGNRGGFCRASFMPVRYHRDGRLKSVLYTNEYVEGEVIKLRGQLETEKALVECLTTLSSTDDFEEAIARILKHIGEFYEADRAYIFNIDYNRNTASNEYEWCKEGIKSQINDMQNVNLEIFSRWIDLFKKKDIVILSNSKNELDPESMEAKLLESCKIESLIVVPFYDSMKKITGFMGIDMPKKNINTDIVLRSAATYIMEEKLKQNYTEELYKMSYSDSMTGSYNRAAYIRDMNELANKGDRSVGILYADVNGLKVTNDTKGHEAGDELILNAIKLLTKYFPKKSDRIYRLGGDEFVVLCFDILQKEFFTKVENLRSELLSNWILSCGGTWFQKITDIDKVTTEAERSMYQNKSDYYKANPRTDRRL